MSSIAWPDAPGNAEPAPQRTTLAGWGRVREALERARSRYVLQLFDAVLTADVVAALGSPTENRRQAVTRSYYRAHLVINALAAVVPGRFARLRRFLLDDARVPFVTRSVKPLSAGTGVTVFVMEPSGARRGEESQVLKIYRRSLGRRLDVLLDQADDRRSRYNRIARWYAACGVVLPTQFLLLHGPVLRRPALAYVQPYVDGAQLDVFSDVSEDELLQLLMAYPTLREQFTGFVDATLRAATEEHACVDIVGRNNLVISTRGEERRLVLLDYGIFCFALKQRAAPRALAELERRLTYLRRIMTRIRAAELEQATGESRAAANLARQPLHSHSAG
jgi:hypothetical protein